MSRGDNPSGVLEVSPEKQIVFQFQTTGQVWSCQRLADGNTLVGAASQGKLLVVNPQNQAEQRLIETEGSSGDKWIVSRGLKAGERVIVEGLQKVRAGAAVVPTPEKQSSTMLPVTE